MSALNRFSPEWSHYSPVVCFSVETPGSTVVQNNAAMRKASCRVGEHAGKADTQNQDEILLFGTNQMGVLMGAVGSKGSTERPYRFENSGKKIAETE